MRIGYVVFGKTEAGQVVVGQLATADMENGGGTIKYAADQEPIAVKEFHRVGKLGNDDLLISMVTESVGIPLASESLGAYKTAAAASGDGESYTPLDESYDEDLEEEEEDESL